MKELKELGLTWFEAQAKARDRLERRNMSQPGWKGWVREWVEIQDLKYVKPSGLWDWKDVWVEEPYKGTQKPET